MKNMLNFLQQVTPEGTRLRSLSSEPLLTDVVATPPTATATLTRPLKIVQREHDAITAFAVCQV